MRGAKQKIAHNILGKELLFLYFLNSLSNNLDIGLSVNDSLEKSMSIFSKKWGKDKII